MRLNLKLKISLLLLLTATVASHATDSKERILGMPLSPAEEIYIQNQNARTRALLDSVDPALAKQIQDRAVELAPNNAPVRVNYFGTDYGIKDGSVVAFGRTEEVLLSKDLLPVDAKFGPFRISPDRSKVAFAYSYFGSDWQIWQIFDLKNKKLISASGEFTLKGFGGPGLSWTPDSKSLVYQDNLSLQEDFQGLRRPRIKHHRLGTSRALDTIVFEDFEQPSSSRWAATAVSNHQAVVFRIQGAAVIPAAAFLVNFEKSQTIPLIEPNKYLGNTPGSGLLGVRNEKAYLRTASLGNEFGVIEVDVNDPKALTNSKVIVPVQAGRILYQALLLGDKIVTQFITPSLGVEFDLYDLKGRLVTSMKPSDFGLIDQGHPSLPFIDGDFTSTAGYFTYSSVGFPPVTFRVDTVKNVFSLLPNAGPINFDGSKIDMKVVRYPSHDGQIVTMLTFQRKDQTKNLAKFAYLYSYGFIGVPNLPQWNRKFQLALELGAIVALPMVRGGGEYGADHQMAGTNDRWNTFMDLVYASRWLKKNVAMEKDRVVAVGRSFGGLTGAVHFVHHQSDFDLVSAIVPVTDWKSHFEMSGWWMGDDFGILRDSSTGKTNQKEADRLVEKNKAWDPVQNLHKLNGKKLIPAIFFSGQYDTNTTPHQTFRFLQNFSSTDPVYMFQHPNGGHGARAELVDEFLFIAKFFGLKKLSPL